jgi:hypothetical protein
MALIFVLFEFTEELAAAGTSSRRSCEESEHSGAGPAALTIALHAALRRSAHE